MEKIDRSYLRKIRYAVQWTILLMVAYSGYVFYIFASELERGALPSVTRPPSIDGFMPIGAAMALKLWITEGLFDPIHPSALIIFVGALLSSLLLKKSFCGWICPVGAISEIVWKIGGNVFGKNFKIHKYIDYPLRSLKYILMSFFLYIIFVKMPPPEIASFLNTPYWKTADIKLMKFFTEMTLTVEIILAVLFGLSLLYKNFWCRYLCPYGGLLGLLSSAGPIKIARDKNMCIQCGLCAKHCPSTIPVNALSAVKTPECTGCLTCISHCPAKNALDTKAFGRLAIKPMLFIAAVIVIFFGSIIIGRISGHWHSSVTNEELLQLTPMLKDLAHP